MTQRQPRGVRRSVVGGGGDLRSFFAPVATTMATTTSTSVAAAATRNGTSCATSSSCTSSSTRSSTVDEGAGGRNHNKKRRRRSTSGSAFDACPLCGMQFPWHTLERHAATCEGGVVSTAIIISGASATNNHNNNNNNIHSERIADTSEVHSSTADAGNVSIRGGDEIHPKHNNDIQMSDHDKNTLTTTTKQQQLRVVVSTDHYDLMNRTPLLLKQPTVKLHRIPPTSMPLPGLYLYENFISEQEEDEILATMDNGTFTTTCTTPPKRSGDSGHYYLPWKPSTFNGKHLGKRWGVHCNLRTRTVTTEHEHNPLPWFLHELLLPKLHALQIPEMLRVGWIPNEANAIDYRRRQGHYLKSHVDNRQLSKEPIANLSLAGDCYMTFCNEKIARQNNNNRNPNQGAAPAVGNGETASSSSDEKRVLLKRRCLQILTGKARYDYSHGIRNADLLSDRRVSLTMRESPLTTTKTTTTTPASSSSAAHCCRHQRPHPNNPYPTRRHSTSSGSGRPSAHVAAAANPISVSPPK